MSFGYHPSFARRITSRTDRRSTTTTYTYDAGWKITQSSTNPTIGQLNFDSLTYDQRSKVQHARMYSRAQAAESLQYVYDVHGAVVAQERTRDVGGYQVEEFRNDAYGNAFYSRTRSSAGGNDAPFVALFDLDGAMYDRHAVLPASPTQNQRNETVSQTASGSDITVTGRLVTNAPINGGGQLAQLAGKQFYGADSRRMVVQRYDHFVGGNTDLGTWEEYWYDALGRRILTRARRDQLSAPNGSRFLCNDTSGSCGSYAQRTLWDGDQLLYEWRVPEGTATGITSGSAGYVHVEGIDQPAGVIRNDGTRVINYNWRGLGESSVFVNGSSGDCAIPFSGCIAVNWPGKTQAGVYYTPNVLATGPGGPYTWFGTLAENGGGSTGMLFRRNRYFDPVSGRFTQQDPIGVAGGMNLYGFADGDPVNFSDPFGLLRCPPNCPSFTEADAQAVFQQLGAQLAAVRPVMEAAASVALLAPMGGGEGAVATLGLTRSVTFFRGVGALEAADVAATGALRAGAVASGNAGKYLTRSASAAAKWGAQYGEGSQVLRVRVPADAVGRFTRLGRIDGIGEAWWAPIEALQGARVRNIGAAARELVPK